jgi:hypothetical protein
MLAADAVSRQRKAAAKMGRIVLRSQTITVGALFGVGMTLCFCALVGDAAKFREIRHYETAFAEVTPKQH